MRRYLVTGINQEALTVELSGEEFHHICEVCRQEVGSKFEVLTENGWALFVEVIHIDKKAKIAVATVLERRQIPPLPKPYIHLALSVPKIATFESVLEKAVELGVHTVHPFFSDYSFVKSTKGIFANKQKRMEKIIKGATQQSSRSGLMVLDEPRSLEDLFSLYKKQSNNYGLFAYEGDEGARAKDCIQRMPSTCEHFWLFVGSEGGFSLNEVDAFKNINLFPVSLGQQVLRVETACVTLLGVIKYELGLF